MQWHLIIEEFGPTMEYIKGPKNIVANTLSHLEMTSKMESLDMAESYGLNSDDLPEDAFPVSYTLLHCKQKKDKTLFKQAQTTTHAYSLKECHGGCTTVCLLCFKDKIVMPTSLTKWIVQWYHYLLCHPGINRTEETIGQHFYWPKSLNMHHLSNSKETIQKVWTFAKKDAKAAPWDRLCINLIGPYNIKSNIKELRFLL
jgi:hypothetical protein